MERGTGKDVYLTKHRTPNIWIHFRLIDWRNLKSHTSMIYKKLTFGKSYFPYLFPGSLFSILKTDSLIYFFYHS